jgi:hypothetical protein
MAIHKNSPEGPQTFHPDHKNGQEPLSTQSIETDPLDVEYKLPSRELYVSDGDVVTPGWQAVETKFNPETMREETLVEKDGVQKLVATGELDDLQSEMYAAQTALRPSLADRALNLVGLDNPGETKHVTVVDPEGNQPPTTIRVRHTD